MASSGPALLAATAALDPPYGVVDLDAFDRNARSLVSRAAGTPIRIATKSVRSRDLVRRALATPGYAGLLAYTLPEALIWASEVADVLVGYPTVDRAALRALVADAEAASRVTLMIDSIEHLDHVTSVVGTEGPPVRVCLDLDVSYRAVGGRVHLGMRRSPLHTPRETVAVARAVVARPGFRLVGLMGYEGQIAGLPDDDGPLPKRVVTKTFQRLSATELAGRRAAVVAAVREVADLEFVNAGGTGSIERTAREPHVTDIAAGSGLFGPTLFDLYSHFQPEPAAFFVLPVVRRPSPEHATVLGGGWIASGPAVRTRLPSPCWPEGLALVPSEGAGEVQTPLVGPGVAALRLGDRVVFRHAKAGELCEHLDTLHLVSGGAVVGTAATYRGEGWAFL